MRVCLPGGSGWRGARMQTHTRAFSLIRRCAAAAARLRPEQIASAVRTEKREERCVVASFPTATWSEKFNLVAYCSLRRLAPCPQAAYLFVCRENDLCDGWLIILCGLMVKKKLVWRGWNVRNFFISTAVLKYVTRMLWFWRFNLIWHSNLVLNPSKNERCV